MKSIEHARFGLLVLAIACSEAPAQPPAQAVAGTAGQAGAGAGGGGASFDSAGMAAAGSPSGGAGGAAGGQAGSAGQLAVETVADLTLRPVNSTCHAPSRPQADQNGTGPAATLSATGCVDLAQPWQPAAGLIFYDVNAPLWSDGTLKRRWLALPDGGKIKVLDSGNWGFPVGTVLVKSFALAERRVETRLLVHHDDGDWAGYSYAWREDGSDADLLASSERKLFGNQEWTYPSRDNCLDCHQAAAGRSLGLETAQLNRDIAYASGPSNQVAAFARIGLFESAPVAPLAALPQPASQQGTVEQRARAYLHSNCSNCHRPGAVSEVSLDLRYDRTLAETKTCDTEPTKGDFGFLGAKLLKPGHPESSLLSIRMRTVIAGVLMPQIGRSTTDEAGVALIDAYITALTACP